MSGGCDLFVFLHRSKNEGPSFEGIDERALVKTSRKEICIYKLYEYSYVKNILFQKSILLQTDKQRERETG